MKERDEMIWWCGSGEGVMEREDTGGRTLQWCWCGVAVGPLSSAAAVRPADSDSDSDSYFADPSRRGVADRLIVGWKAVHSSPRKCKTHQYILSPSNRQRGAARGRFFPRFARRAPQLRFASSQLWAVLSVSAIALSFAPLESPRRKKSARVITPRVSVCDFVIVAVPSGGVLYCVYQVWLVWGVS